MRYSVQEYCIIINIILFCFVCPVVQSDALMNYPLPTSRYTSLAAPPVFNPFSNGLNNNPYINSFSFPPLSSNYSSYGLNGEYFNTPPAITPSSRIWNLNQDYSELSVNYQEPANVFGSLNEQLLSQGALFPGIGLGGMESLWLGFPGIGMTGFGVPGLGFPGIGVSGSGVLGLGFPGIGMQGFGISGLSGVRFPGIGITGFGVPGLGFPGIGMQGFGISGLFGVGFPGIGMPGSELSGIGFPGSLSSGIGLTVGGNDNGTTQFSSTSPVLIGPSGELISELPFEALPEYISSIIPTLPIIPPQNLSIPMVDFWSQIYEGARVEGMSQTIYILLMDNGDASSLPLKDILGEGIYCIKMNNGPGVKTSFNIHCGDACHTLSLYLEINSLSPIWAWNAKWW